MQTVLLGNTIIFDRHYYDSEGEDYVPTEVTLKIVKNAIDLLAGPFTLSNGDIQEGALGGYYFEWEVPEHTTPAIYQARWEAEVEGEETVYFEAFQVNEVLPAPQTLLDAPRITGIMRESALYRTMGLGETDRIFLIGHGAGLTLNDPYQVVNMKEAVNILGASSESPIIRALLECYNLGARDIWIVLAAPETEYVPFSVDDPTTRLQPRDEWGGLNFYERYAERLETTYSILKDFDYPEIVVPVEASYANAGDVDFLTPLVEHCEQAFISTGAPRIGILGTRIGNITAEDITTMATDPRLGDFGSAGKFSMVVVGEGVFSLPQMPASHVSSIAVTAAAALATSAFDSGLTYKKLNTVMSPYSRQLTKDEIKTLVRARLNPLIRTSKGKRGTPFQAVMATDNTLSEEGSDYWSVVQMRLVTKVIAQIRTLGMRSLGTIGYMQFQSEIANYLQSLVAINYIRTFDLDISRDPTDQFKVLVDLSLTPYFGVRELFFQVQVGPGV